MRRKARVTRTKSKKQAVRPLAFLFWFCICAEQSVLRFFLAEFFAQRAVGVECVKAVLCKAPVLAQRAGERIAKHERHRARHRGRKTQRVRLCQVGVKQTSL